MNFSKQEIRRFFLQRRKDLDKIYRQEAEKKIIAKLLQSWEFINSKNIAFYYSDGYEVDVKELFLATNMEKNFYLPRYIVDKKLYEMVKINDLDKDLQVGKYGLLEPKKELFAASKNELEQMLFLVPGVAFDEKLQRLGRGGGFYDRLLENAKFKIGLFFECQKAEKIPVEKHDLPMDMILTEKNIYKN